MLLGALVGIGLGVVAGLLFKGNDVVDILVEKEKISVEKAEKIKSIIPTIRLFFVGLVSTYFAGRVGYLIGDTHGADREFQRIDPEGYAKVKEILELCK